MSNKEILQWLIDHEDEISKCFTAWNYNTIGDVVDNLGVTTIEHVIEEYESEKNKPIELEWVKVVRIIKDTGDKKACVWESDDYNHYLPKDTVKALTENRLRDYFKTIDRNDGAKYFAVVEDICRVKE